MVAYLSYRSISTYVATLRLSPLIPGLYIKNFDDHHYNWQWDCSRSLHDKGDPYHVPIVTYEYLSSGHHQSHTLVIITPVTFHPLSANLQSNNDCSNSTGSHVYVPVTKHGQKARQCGGRIYNRAVLSYSQILVIHGRTSVWADIE